MWTLNESLDLGFEGFGEFDVDQHAWGPRASFALGPTVASVTYLSSLGADAEADGQLRLSLDFAPH